MGAAVLCAAAGVYRRRRRRRRPPPRLRGKAVGWGKVGLPGEPGNPAATTTSTPLLFATAGAPPRTPPRGEHTPIVGTPSSVGTAEATTPDRWWRYLPTAKGAAQGGGGGNEAAAEASPPEVQRRWLVEKMSAITSAISSASTSPSASTDALPTVAPLVAQSPGYGNGHGDMPPEDEAALAAFWVPRGGSGGSAGAPRRQSLVDRWLSGGQSLPEVSEEGVRAFVGLSRSRTATQMSDSNGDELADPVADGRPPRSESRDLLGL